MFKSISFISKTIDEPKFKVVPPMVVGLGNNLNSVKLKSVKIVSTPELKRGLLFRNTQLVKLVNKFP